MRQPRFSDSETKVKGEIMTWMHLKSNFKVEDEMMPDVNVRRKYIQTQPFEKCVGKMDKNEFTSKWAQSKV